MTDIFISYRRDDSQAITDRIHEHLVNAFDEERVFKDVDDIPIGADFRQVLSERVQSCRVLLVVIGKQWANITYDNGDRRLNDANDFVRIEVESGLIRDDLLVVPVMVNNAQMPAPNTLPESLRPLCYRNNVVIRNDPDFRSDIQRLIHRLSQVIGEPEPPQPQRTGGGFKLPFSESTLVGLIAGILVTIGILFVIGNSLNNGSGDSDNSDNGTVIEDPIEESAPEDLTDVENNASASVDFYEGSVLEFTAESDDMIKFADLLGHASMEITEVLLDDESSVTVFVPSDDAWNRFLEEFGFDFDDLLGDPNLVDTLMSYHFVDNQINPDDLATYIDEDLTMWNDESISIGYDDDEWLFNDFATLFAHPVTVTNGIIYPIDHVLIPAEFLGEDM